MLPVVAISVIVATVAAFAVPRRRRTHRGTGVSSPPPPISTVSSLAALAAQIERLHVLRDAGMLSDDELARAEMGLLERVPEA